MDRASTPLGRSSFRFLAPFVRHALVNGLVWYLVLVEDEHPADVAVTHSVEPVGK